VFTRRLAVHLLAPTVLVSLVLVGACAFAAVYLNYLNVHVSDLLRENVRSTQVAARLETTIEELARLFASNIDDTELRPKVEEQNQEIRQLLADADELANYEGERELVDEIRSGLKEYLGRWDHRMESSVSLNGGNAALSRLLEQRVLAPCRRLHRFNTDQIEKSEQEARKIADTLKWALIAGGIGGPILGLLLGYGVARSLRHSIYQLSVRIRDAAGRLNREVGSVRLDEEGDLPDLHKQMQHVLDEIERVIDQLQQREREVLRSEQLAAVGQVAAGVAHELRNPLTAIKMLVQTGMEGTTPTGVPAEDLAVMEGEVRRMEQTIQLFIDFARPPRSERRPNDLVEIVRKAMALVEGRAHKQHVVLDADLPVGPVVANVDAGQIHQVLVNLLLNSLDALPQGGKVRVSVSRMGKNLEVTVKDNGPGIAPAIFDRLFEPFVSSKDTGLGLGLSISKRLIEGHGGAIRGGNAAGGGAVFAFELRE
jgi:signal transduction histidine kinase